MNEADIKGTLWDNTGKVRYPLFTLSVKRIIPVQCFYTMGKHYWYNMHKATQCKDMVPYCLLYNGGKLNAFCMAVNTHFEGDYFDTPRPDTTVLHKFMSDVPACMDGTNPSYSTFSTIHVYTNTWPRSSSFC